MNIINCYNSICLFIIAYEPLLQILNFNLTINLKMYLDFLQMTEYCYSNVPLHHCNRTHFILVKSSLTDVTVLISFIGNCLLRLRLFVYVVVCNKTGVRSFFLIGFVCGKETNWENENEQFVGILAL